MVNNYSNFGLCFETVLIILIVYVPFLNIPLATRQLAFPHIGIIVAPWFILMILYDETRKIFIRLGTIKVSGQRLKYAGWAARNTFY